MLDFESWPLTVDGAHIDFYFHPFRSVLRNKKDSINEAGGHSIVHPPTAYSTFYGIPRQSESLLFFFALYSPIEPVFWVYPIRKIACGTRYNLNSNDSGWSHKSKENEEVEEEKEKEKEEKEADDDDRSVFFTISQKTGSRISIRRQTSWAGVIG